MVYWTAHSRISIPNTFEKNMTENAPAAKPAARSHFGGFRSGGEISSGSSPVGGDSTGSVSAEVGGELTSLTGNRRFSMRTEKVAKAETTTVRDPRTNNLLAEQIGGDMTVTPLNGEYAQMYSAASQIGNKKLAQGQKDQTGDRTGDPNLYAFNGAKTEAGKFDPKKSVAELLTDPALQGRLRIADQAANPNDAARMADKIGPGEKPTIKVVYQDQSDNPNKPQADFIVKKDGTIQVVNDHERNPDKEICVVVERAKGETGAPPAEQQKATDQLVDYLAQRLTDKFYPQSVGPDGKPINNVPIEDKQNLDRKSTRLNSSH